MGGGSARADAETLERGAARLERVWLGLRTDEGLPRRELDSEQLERVRDWERRGWAELDPERVRLSLEGWLLLDRLTVELDSGADRRLENRARRGQIGGVIDVSG